MGIPKDRAKNDPESESEVSTSAGILGLSVWLNEDHESELSGHYISTIRSKKVKVKDRYPHI
jgi:hypothetical protein